MWVYNGEKREVSEAINNKETPLSIISFINRDAVIVFIVGSVCMSEFSLVEILLRIFPYRKEPN